MNKTTENIIEMSICFTEMLNNGKIKFPEEDSVSVRDQFKEHVEEWSKEFEISYNEEIPYLDAIEIFLLHHLKSEGWIEETDTNVNFTEYGYTWKEMKHLTFLDAAYRFAIEGKSVYLLFSDNTEAEASNLEEISEHQNNGGIFGYELETSNIRFVMNDHFYEDDWVNPYIVRAKIAKDTTNVISDLQKIANSLYESELSSGAEGIEKILQKYQENTPDNLVSYTIECIPCVCFGRLVEE